LQEEKKKKIFLDLTPTEAYDLLLKQRRQEDDQEITIKVENKLADLINELDKAESKEAKREMLR